jgi:hypothetical protein
MFTLRNTVLVALMQVGVIVAGVLASGLGHRFSVINQMPLPLPTVLLYDYGVLWFALPICWAGTALTVRNRADISDDAKQLVFLLGILLIVVLAVFVLYADISSWLRIEWNMGGE